MITMEKRWANNFDLRVDGSVVGTVHREGYVALRDALEELQGSQAEVTE